MATEQSAAGPSASSSDYSSLLSTTTSATSPQAVLHLPRVPQLSASTPLTSSHKDVAYQLVHQIVPYNQHDPFPHARIQGGLVATRADKGKGRQQNASGTPNSLAHGLAQDIEDFFQLAQPSANERATRVTCIERIQRAINNVNLTHQNTRPAAGYTCFPFGSTLTGIDTAGSDLDLCIIDNDRLDGFVGRYRRQDLPALHNMRALAHVLRKSGFSNVEPIVNAAVPICKFQFYFRGVRIVGDANCNEQLGLLNSQLIAAYCDLSPMLRRVCVFIKHWAKSRDLNDPAGEHGPLSISSYTYTLMLIAYLQHLRALPNLQDPSRTANEERRFFWSRPRFQSDKRGVRHDVTWSQPLASDAEAAANLRLASLVEGFFRFFAFEFDPDEQVVSIVRGGIVPRTPASTSLERSPRERSPLGWPSADIESDDEEIVYSGDPRIARHDTLVETQTERDAERHLQVPSTWSTASAGSSVLDDDDYEITLAASRMTWPHPFVVQDPFMLARNTATNIEQRVYERLRRELCRAYELVSAGATLDEICAPIFTEPEYVAAQAERDQFRRPPRNGTGSGGRLGRGPPQAPRPTGLPGAPLPNGHLEPRGRGRGQAHGPAAPFATTADFPPLANGAPPMGRGQSSAPPAPIRPGRGRGRGQGRGGSASVDLSGQLADLNLQR